VGYMDLSAELAEEDVALVAILGGDVVQEKTLLRISTTTGRGDAVCLIVDRVNGYPETALASIVDIHGLELRAREFFESFLRSLSSCLLGRAHVYDIVVALNMFDFEDKEKLEEGLEPLEEWSEHPMREIPSLGHYCNAKLKSALTHGRRSDGSSISLFGSVLQKSFEGNGEETEFLRQGLLEHCFMIVFDLLQEVLSWHVVGQRRKCDRCFAKLSFFFTRVPTDVVSMVEGIDDIAFIRNLCLVFETKTRYTVRMLEKRLSLRGVYEIETRKRSQITYQIETRKQSQIK
jgi:hypothetical protein